MDKDDYSAINRNEILPLSSTWADLEYIILNKSDRERYFLLSHMNVIIHRYKKTTMITRSRAEQDGSMWLRDTTYYV